jgi:hypothetical protein
LRGDLRGQRLTSTTWRLSRWFYRARRAKELRHDCGDGRDVVVTPLCFSGVNHLTPPTNGRGADEDEDVVVNGLGGGLKQRLGRGLAGVVLSTMRRWRGGRWPSPPHGSCMSMWYRKGIQARLLVARLARPHLWAASSGESAPFFILLFLSFFLFFAFGF